MSTPKIVDKYGVLWAKAHDEPLLKLMQRLSIEEVQKTYFPFFTVTQIREIASKARTRLQKTNLVQKQVTTGPDSDEDEVIDKSFEPRRGGEPAWQGKTTAWEHRGKPGIGWLPVEERPDMETFVREHGKLPYA